MLGDIHDCDVMLPRVEGIHSLTTLLRARRELLFRDFHDLWQAEASSGTWAALNASSSRAIHRFFTRGFPSVHKFSLLMANLGGDKEPT